MRRSLLFLVLSALFAGTAVAQTAPLKFTLPTVDTTYSVLLFEQLPSGGFILATRQAGWVGAGSTMIRTDADGTPLSADRTTEIFECAIRCSDGGYLMYGSALVKTDSAFNILWAKKLIPHPGGFYSYRIMEHDNHYYLSFSMPEGVMDTILSPWPTHAAILFRFETSGNLVNQRILTHTAFSSNRFNLHYPKLDGAGDGSLYVSMGLLEWWAAGTCNRWPSIIKLDSGLNVQWAYTYRASSYNSLPLFTVLSDGNLALYGDYGSNLTGCSPFHHYLLKADTSGAILFAKDYRHPFNINERTNQLIERPDSTLLFKRSYTDTLTGAGISYLDHVDASTGALLHSMGYSDSTQGVAQRIADERNGLIPTLALNRDTFLMVAVDSGLQVPCYGRSNTMVETPLTFTQTSFPVGYINYSFSFIDTVVPAFQPVPYNSWNVSCVPIGIAPRELPELFRVYPVPANGRLTLTCSQTGSHPVIVVIFNIYGQKVFSSTTSPWQQGESRTFNIGALAPGSYILQATAGEKVFREKIMKE